MADIIEIIQDVTTLTVASDGPQGPTGPTGATGATGAQGPSGVLSVTAPITNSGTSTSAVIGINAGVANGVATLDSGGKVPQSQIPAVAITNTFVVASQAAMLALTAEEGDVAVRTDLNKTYILAATPASTLGNWQELLTPTDSVTSVDGRVGTVTLSDLYAAKTHAATHASAGSDPVTLAQSQITNLTTDLAAKAPLASPTFTGTVTIPAGSSITGVPYLATANTFTQPQTANSFIPTSSTVPANGIYLPSANTLGFATNSVYRGGFNATGGFNIASLGYGTVSVAIEKNITGGTTAWSIYQTPMVQSDVTTNAYIYHSSPSTQAAAFTLTTLNHYSAQQGTFGVGSAVTNQIGFYAQASLTGGTNNYGFYGAINVATNRWNTYMSGTAANYFAGQTTVGSTSLTLGSGSVAQQFGIVSAAASNVVAVIRGAASQTGNLTEWQNSAGTILSRIASNGDFLSTVTIGAAFFSDGTATRPYIDFTTANKLIVQTRNAAYVGLTVKGSASQSANLQEWQDSTGSVVASLSAVGSFTTAGDNFVSTRFIRSNNDSASSIVLPGSQNVHLGGGTASLGGGVSVVGIRNAQTVPTTNPTGGGILYVEAGALKYRGSSGTVTTIANA